MTEAISTPLCHRARPSFPVRTEPKNAEAGFDGLEGMKASSGAVVRSTVVGNFHVENAVGTLWKREAGCGNCVMVLVSSGEGSAEGMPCLLEREKKSTSPTTSTAAKGIAIHVQ